MKVNTKSVHFTADQKLLEFVDTKMAKLEQYFDKIIEVDVVMKLENSGQVRDKVAEMRVKVPGDVLISKETSKTFESAIGTGSDALKRQLLKYKERLRSHMN